MKISRGTPEQFLNAVRRQIEYLDGDNVEACDNIMSSYDMYEDCDGSLVGRGKRISRDDLINIWKANHNSDPCMSQYDTFDEWIDDTRNNGYIKPVDGACNSANIMAGVELSIEDQEKVYEISDRYVASTPVSGDWDSEVFHEQQAIADELDVPLAVAKEIMKEYLGFTDDMFEVTASSAIKAGSTDKTSKDDYVTYDFVQAGENVEDVQTVDDGEPILADDGPEFEQYITELADDVSNAIQQDFGVDNVDWQNDDEKTGNMYASVPYNGHIYEFTIPYADLKHDNTKDLKYIVDEIASTLK